MIGHADIPATMDAAAQRLAATLPEFLSAAEKSRLARIVAGRQLYDGKWRAFLLADGRTAHLFKALQDAQGRERPLLVTVNVLGLAARKTADLLMLDPPDISAGEDFPLQAEAIERINQASHIEPVLYEGALTATYEGESWLQVMRHNGRVIIANVPADQCFGVGDLGPDGSYPTVERRWIERVGSGPAARTLLRVEAHTAGLVANRLYALGRRGQIEAQLPLPAGLPEQLETGVDEPLLDFVPNFAIGGRCISDFDGVDELVDQFTAGVSQAARVLAKHADPKLGIPEDLFDEEGAIKASAEAFALKSKDELPVYLTWNAQLDAAIKMIDHWLRWLLVVIEMSPALLGLKEGAAPDAYKKLRLEAFNTLAKVGRKKLYWHRVVKDLYRRAHKLENAPASGSAGVRVQRYDHAEVGVDWHDGIPLDESERVHDVIDKRVAGVIDRTTAVEQIEGVEEAEQIVERLAAEDASARQVTMNLGEGPVIRLPGELPGGEEVA